MEYIDIDNTLKETIASQYLNGVSASSLSDTYDICLDLIYQVLYERGAVRNRFYSPRYKNRSDEWKRAVAWYYGNHSRFECREFFHVSVEAIDNVITELGLKKRTHAEDLRLCKINKYGSIETFNKLANEKSRATSLERYGVDNFAKSPLFVERSQATFMAKYGVSNPMKNEEVKKQFERICLERFGVSWPCMRAEARRYQTIRSGPNQAFYNELIQYVAEKEVIREFPLEKYSYDFKYKNTLIEINPSPTHNSTWGIFNTEGVSKTYHHDKSLVARNNGYRCIHVWDWDSFSKVIRMVIPRDRIYARQCSVVSVSVEDSRLFLDAYHLQNYARSDIRLGLEYNGKIVSIMTFGKPRYNSKYEYELIRYCSCVDVIGGAEKLFKHFIRSYNPTSVISYCDDSKFNGSTYVKLGFVYDSTSIGKHWVSIKNGKHITDNLLRQRGFDQLLGKEYGCYGKGTSNEQLMLDHGFVEIFDAGQSTYVWKNS